MSLDHDVRLSTRILTLTTLAFCVTLILSASHAAASPASEAAALEEELAGIRSDFKKAGAAYDEAYWELDETEVRLGKIDDDIDRTVVELASARQVLGSRLDRMYRADSVDYLTVLLGATTFQEMVTRLEFVRRIGQADADAIAAVDDLQARLVADRKELEVAREEQVEKTKRLKSERDALQKRLSKAQGRYDEAKAKLDAIRRQSSGASSSSGVPAAPGANGMVFPVQGPNYYSDTWGASRSGGRRRHQGTDIMSPNGTPCVAVLSGTIRAKTSGLGGNTIWLTADNGWQFYYAHLDSWAVTSGRVSAGQVIGYVGSTGNASASSPHLHFEIHPGGGAVNPYPYLRQMQ